MATPNKPYPTLHSPDQVHGSTYSLHTPVEASPTNAYYPPPPSQYSSEQGLRSPEYPQQSFSPPPGSTPALSHAEHQSFSPLEPPMNTHLSANVPSPHSSPPASPGLSAGGESYMMTPRSPPPAFDHQHQYHTPQGPPAQSYPPPPAFDANNPYAPPPQTAHERQPGSPTQINTPGYNTALDSTNPPTPKTPAYTPSGSAGPNGAVHAPGQIGHPNQQHGPEPYHHGLCDCFSDISTCCMGYWCPCMLYSRTYHRLKTVPNSNLNEFSACNAHCALFCVVAPVSWILTMLQRTRIRENYRLQGSAFNDCCKAYYCVMCTLVQDDREVAHREDERRRFAGPGNGAVGDGRGYQRNNTMVYR